MAANGSDRCAGCRSSSNPQPSLAGVVDPSGKADHGEAQLNPRSGKNAMLIVDSQIHIWENSKMSAHHRQIPTYSEDDALNEMAQAGVDAAVLHPPSTLGEAVDARARGAGKP